ncbi:MAG: molybdenum cofactor biosynthesis protein MoaE [Bryobacterales bacterium]|nr:molybdenum cofactor biosynthesis protein MoaE [Bryobacteraceae bacterium]MDW8353817.1 molybdenum cofactor biosynthesis protein MoaE [Bryobacterales bacterium]
MKRAVRVKVLFFGVLKEVVGAAQDELELAEPARVGDVLEAYAQKFPRINEMSSSIVPARNRQFAARSEEIRDGDEIALLPPVSGGAGPYTHLIEDPAGHFFALTRRPIETQEIVRRLQRDEDGAVVEFRGVVRNNTRGRPTRMLDYDCYEPMAIEIMARIGRALAAERPIGRIAMVHRLGRLEVGETSVAIVVTAPHREAAFAAALEAINRLKLQVPIWKKEHFADGEVWVEGQWDPSLRSG